MRIALLRKVGPPVEQLEAPFRPAGRKSRRALCNNPAIPTPPADCARNRGWWMRTESGCGILRVRKQNPPVCWRIRVTWRRTRYWCHLRSTMSGRDPNWSGSSPQLSSVVTGPPHPDALDRPASIPTLFAGTRVAKLGVGGATALLVPHTAETGIRETLDEQAQHPLDCTVLLCLALRDFP